MYTSPDMKRIIKINVRLHEYVHFRSIFNNYFSVVIELILTRYWPIENVLTVGPTLNAADETVKSPATEQTGNC